MSDHASGPRTVAEPIATELDVQPRRCRNEADGAARGRPSRPLLAGESDRARPPRRPAASLLPDDRGTGGAHGALPARCGAIQMVAPVGRRYCARVLVAWIGNAASRSA